MNQKLNERQKTAFTGSNILYKKRKENGFQQYERGYSIRNGFTLIWITVSANTKFALKKKALQQKSVSTRRNE